MNKTIKCIDRVASVCVTSHTPYGAQADARYRAPLRASPLASLCAALEYTSLGCAVREAPGRISSKGFKQTRPTARPNPMYHGSSLILLPDVCELPRMRQRKRKAPVPVFEPAPAPPPPRPAPISSKGFKQKKSTYRLSAAPSGRGRCRRCRAFIAKGETRLEVCAFVRPGRYTLLLRCTASACIDAQLSAAILSVYKNADRVPVDAALEGGAEAHRVVRAITSAGLNA